MVAGVAIADVGAAPVVKSVLGADVDSSESKPSSSQSSKLMHLGFLFAYLVPCSAVRASPVP